jgi:hypothetical protein
VGPLQCCTTGARKTPPDAAGIVFSGGAGGSYRHRRGGELGCPVPAVGVHLRKVRELVQAGWLKPNNPSSFWKGRLLRMWRIDEGEIEALLARVEHGRGPLL